MKRIAVLGTGLVGRVVVHDLASHDDIHVVAVDRREEAVGEVDGLSRVEVRTADLSRSEESERVARDVDVVVSAVPGALGACVQRTVIEVGRPLADIAFTPGDPLILDRPARERGVPVVVDCGVAPGLSNLFAGCSAARLDEVDTVLIYVGGLPLRRMWPYEYRVVFSPTDVIEEYTRPSRLREEGREVVRPALSDVEQIEFDEVGTLEAFNTDGLRTLLSTLPARTLREKTLRYPGHAERMRVLRETGFFGKEPIDVGGVRIAPRALAERLLFEAWKLPEGDEEITILRVIVEGVRAGSKVRTTWDLVDRTDRSTGFTSMARTTGFPCAIVARLLARGTWDKPGVCAPEILGRDSEVTRVILEELAELGVNVSSREESLPASR